MTHFASLSHSPVFLQRREGHHESVSRRASRKLLKWKQHVPAVDTDAVFCHLVLARLQIAEDFLRDFGKVTTLDQTEKGSSVASGEGRYENVGTHLSVLRKISRRRDSPSGLYLRLNLFRVRPVSLSDKDALVAVRVCSLVETCCSEVTCQVSNGHRTIEVDSSSCSRWKESWCACISSVSIERS